MAAWNRYTELQFGRITTALKRKRVDLFVRTLGLGPQDRILDLGSLDGSYLASFYPYPQNIVLADISEESMKRGVARYGLKGYILLPFDGPIPADDKEFDAVWCNSCVEHVSVDDGELATVSTREFRARSDAHQRLFAREISRICRKYFVQTPYLHFPIESHSWLPGVQYLPHKQHMKLSRILKRFWVKQWTPNFYLYDSRRFRCHFADATCFAVERVCGIPKSLYAVRNRGNSSPSETIIATGRRSQGRQFRVRKCP